MDHHPRSALLRLKEYPPEATAATILNYLEQYGLLRSLQIERIDVSGLSPELTLKLAALVKRCDAWTLKRFAEPKYRQDGKDRRGIPIITPNIRLGRLWS